MTRDARRTYHHGNLREALLEAAEASIEVEGVRGLSLRQLGLGLGVSHTSAQRHFADKRALLEAVAQRGFERLGAELFESDADRKRDFSFRLTRLAQAHVAFSLRRPALFRWMFEATSAPDTSASLLEASDRALSPASAILADGQASHAVVPGDPEHLGLASFAAVQGLVSMSIGGKFNGVPLDTLVSDVIERIILGLRPRP